MNWFRKFMYGRYGVDAFSMTLIVIGLLLSLFSNTLKLPPIIFTIIIIFAYYRAFSKDINKRYRENEKFLQSVKPITSRFNSVKGKANNRKKFKYFKCKNCRQKIRVPRGKGKIKVTCPKCGEKVVTKS